MSTLNVEQSIQLARALCADIQKTHPEVYAAADADENIRGALAQDIDEARRLFAQQVTADHVVVFERAVEVCLVQQKPERLRDDPMVRPLLQASPHLASTPLHKNDPWPDFVAQWPERLGAQVSLVDVTSQQRNDHLMVVARLPEDGLDDAGCSVRVERSGRGLFIAGHGRLPSNAPEVTLTPQRGRFVSLRKLGEMEIGIPVIDDAAIIRGVPTAKLLLQACETPLARLMPHDFRVDVDNAKLTVELLDVDLDVDTAASLADAIIDLWARMGHEVHLKQSIYGGGA